MHSSPKRDSGVCQPSIVATHECWRVLKLGKTQALFTDCLKIRASHAGNPVSCMDRFDDTADIYLLLEAETPLATMRINQARRGPLDCEEFYPAEFLDEFRSLIGSASRFARKASTKPDLALMRRFVREVWRDQFADGMRVDLINVHAPMVPYYRRLGYELVCNSFFRHPRLATDSYVMCLIATPEVPGGLGQVFQSRHEPGQFHRLKTALNFCRPESCAQHASPAYDVKRLICPGAGITHHQHDFKPS